MSDQVIYLNDQYLKLSKLLKNWNEYTILINHKEKTLKFNRK
jgi:hypothetical protein